MKKYFISFTLVFYTLFFSTPSCYSQGLAVNTDGSTADPSAMLEVKATNKGVLVPRLTSTSNVTSPVTGLLVYQTNAPAGFYYYDGAAWLLLQNTGNIIAASDGGAGSVNGILKANGSGTVTAAVAGTDYLAPTGSAAALTGFPTLNQSTTGNAATATLASTVTTNANLTGDVTSVGNATNIGTGKVTIADLVTTGMLPAFDGSKLTRLAADSLATGIVPAARLGTGTADATTFLEGDGKWVVPASGGGSFPAIITATTALTSIPATTTTYQNMKSITLPATGYYLITAFVNITTHQQDDQYEAKMTQGGVILTGSTDYFAVDGLLSLSAVVTITSGNLATPVLIQCNNAGDFGPSSGTAVGTYSVVKLSN